jgi:hypothetical protein
MTISWKSDKKTRSQILRRDLFFSLNHSLSFSRVKGRMHIPYFQVKLIVAEAPDKSRNSQRGGVESLSSSKLKAEGSTHPG